LHWQRDKVDFLELFSALLHSKSIRMSNDKVPTQKDFFELMCWIFNIQIGNISGNLSVAHNRKIERTPYLKELITAFNEQERE
jgi:hypothetical protein